MPSPFDPRVSSSSGLQGYDDPRLAVEVSRILDELGALEAVKTARSVVLKPNWVHHQNPLGYDTSSLVTQTSVIEAVAASVAGHLQPGSRVLVADAPVQSCDFERLLQNNGIPESMTRLRRRFPDVQFAIADWRLVHAASRLSLFATERVDEWDDRTHVLLDAGTRSFFEPVSDRADRFRVTCYAPEATRARHRPGHHAYLVARAALEADVFINLPKLKTHIKAGITCALKNLVGINGHKEFLPHHVTGSPATGGDSHRDRQALRDRFERYYDFHFQHLAQLPRPFISVLSRALNSADRLTAGLDSSNFGSWPGNDTVWRMTLDLNHLLYDWASPRPRQIFSLVDAVTVGTGDGPLKPQPAPLGVLFGGCNPATVDALGAQLLGFEPMALPTIRHALTDRQSSFAAAVPELGALAAISARRPLNWERVAAPSGR